MPIQSNVVSVKGSFDQTSFQSNEMENMEVVSSKAILTQKDSHMLVVRSDAVETHAHTGDGYLDFLVMYVLV